MSESSGRLPARNDGGRLEQSIADVRATLTGLKFGNVNVTVHEGQVLQIDVTEKKRLRQG